MISLLLVLSVSLICQTQVSAVDNICNVTNPASVRQLVSWDENPAMCDTESDGGGWVLIQRRMKGDVNFYQDWATYTEGFGVINGDFWLGLRNIHLLCNTSCELRVDFGYNGPKGDEPEKLYFSQYRGFSVAGEEDKFRLTLTTYVDGNTPTDSLYVGNTNIAFRTLEVDGAQFSTYDSDNDNLKHTVYVNDACTYYLHGGWWYNRCGATNLNGEWRNHGSGRRGMWWKSVTGLNAVSWSEIKVRVSKGVDWSRLNTQPILPTEIDDLTYYCTLISPRP